MSSMPPPGDLSGCRARREPARIVALDDGRFGLAVPAGTGGRDLASLAQLIGEARYVDHARPEAGGASVVLIFQAQAPGVAPSPPQPSNSPPAAIADAVTTPGDLGGWVPPVAAATGPDRGITPHQLAVWELLTAAPDGASGARLTDAVMRRLPPDTVVALADLLRDRRGCRCTCRA